MRFRHHDAARCVRWRICKRRRNQNDSGTRLSQEWTIACLRREADVLGRSAVEWRNATYCSRALATKLSANDVCNGNSGESASTLTAGGRNLFARANHLSGGRVTPAGLVVRPFAGAAVGLGAAFSLVITLSVISRLLSAATMMLVCEPTSKIIA